MKKRIRMSLCLILAMLFICVYSTVTVQASAKIPNKLYKMVKGKKYVQASSGGCTVKFTKTRVKYYDTDTNHLVYSAKIIKVKKIKSGKFKGRYRIVFKNANGTSSFINKDKKAKSFSYYDGASGYSGYSGSSSLVLIRGK